MLAQRKHRRTRGLAACSVVQPLVAMPGSSRDSAKQPRQVRQVQTESENFALAEVTRHGEFTGWGVTCYLHCQDGRCNKNLTVNAGMSSEAAQHRLKHWAILGFTIKEGPGAMDQHMYSFGDLLG